MQANWIVVADAARARIFHWAGRERTLDQIYQLDHPQTELHEGDLRTGGKGEVIQSSSSVTFQSGPNITTTEKHAQDFAKELAEFLRKKRNRDEFNGLVLVAAPRFLGRLRENLDSDTSQMVEREIDKNWAQHDRRKIVKLLNSEEQ